MMKKLEIFSCLLSFILLLLAACSPVRVLETEAKEGFQLSNYSTFDFYEVEATGEELGNYASELDYLKSQIAQELQKRGLQQSTTAPDLKVNIGVAVAEKVQTREKNLTTDPITYIGQRRYTWKAEEVVVRRYQQGTLSLHLVNNAQNELVWQGSAEGVLPDDNKEKLQERINEGVQKLVKEIPQ